MKKVIVILASAALLFCSCSGDACKCTTKTFSGKGEEITSVTSTTKLSEGKKCSDLEKAGTHDLGELGKTTVKCKTVSE